MDINLPDRLVLPLNFARGARFSKDLSARDISYGLTVGWLAAQRAPSNDDAPITLGGNALRYALGRTRRDAIEHEEDRAERLSNGSIDTPHGKVPLPVLPYRGGIRVDDDVQQQWHLDPRLPFSMRVGMFVTEVVELPTRLLQFARHKESVTMMMRLLAWIEGHHENKWLIEREDRFHVFRISPDELVKELGLSGRISPSHLIERILEPAAAEITEFTGYDVGIHAIRTAYRARNGRTGKVKHIEIRIAIPEMEPVRVIPKRQKGKSWRAKTHPLKIGSRRKQAPMPAPAEIDNVVPFRPVKSDTNWRPGVRENSKPSYYSDKTGDVSF